MSISAIKILDKSETYTRQNAVSEPLIQMTDSKEFPMSQKRQFCRLTKAGSNDVRMIVQVGVGAIRADESKTAIVSIDSGDSSYALGMKMGKCRDIKAD